MKTGSAAHICERQPAGQFPGHQPSARRSFVRLMMVCMQLRLLDNDPAGALIYHTPHCPLGWAFWLPAADTPHTLVSPRLASASASERGEHSCWEIDAPHTALRSPFIDIFALNDELYAHITHPHFSMMLNKFPCILSVIRVNSEFLGSKLKTVLVLMEFWKHKGNFIKPFFRLKMLKCPKQSIKFLSQVMFHCFFA
jgi:hypothetical protein